MKKFFYSLVLCAIAAIPAFAQNTLTVYDGGAENAYVPVYGFYADAFQKVEFVMNSSDLEEMTGATLTKMTWYLATPAAAAWEGNFQVYLKETDANTVSAYDDLTGAILVWEGPLDGTGNTIELEFANDFMYEGGNLLVIVHQTVKGTYKSATFAGAEVAGAAVQGYSYNSVDQVNLNNRDFLPKTTFEYTPGQGVIYYKPKNLAVEAGVNDAVVTWENGGDETSWGVEYKKAADEEWTDAGTVTEKTITLEGLAAGTKYDVRVKSIYDYKGESNWTLTSFATLACEETDMGEVEYLLTDTYGDGWNGGAKLQVFLAGTDVLVQEITLPQASGNSELEGTFKLCYGVDYDLVWVAGTYNYEDGFVLTGPEGETIYEFVGTGSSSGPVPEPGVLTTFQIHMNTCPRPTDVVAENITYNSADIAWIAGTPEQDLFEVVYAKGEFDPEAIDMVPVQVNEPFVTLELEENSAYSVYVRSVCSSDDQSRWSKVCKFETPLQFPLPENFAVTDITAKSAVGTWEGEAGNYNLRYREIPGFSESFEEDFTGDGWMLYDEEGDGWGIIPIAEYTMEGVALFAADGSSCLSACSVDDNYNYVSGDNWIFTPQVPLSGTLKFYAADLGEGYEENFSVYVAVGAGEALEDYQPIAEGLSTNGAGPYSPETWGVYEFDLSAFEGQTGRVAIVHNRTGESGYYLFVDMISIVDESIGEIEWTVMENVNSPATMAPLKPSTRYEAQVQSVYESKPTSQWTESVKFMTLAIDAMPTAVEVTNITATTADVEVAGSQDTYNIRYRTAAKGFMEDFEGIATNGDPAPEGWTTIDADGDTYTWFAWYPASIGVDEVDNNGGATVLDHVCMTSASWQSQVVLYPDNWLITPKVDLGGTLSLWARGQDPSYAGEHFAIYVSVDGNTDTADFVEVLPETIATGVYAEYTADLSEYEGMEGYVAIRHFNVSDMFRLNIDNISIVMEGQEAGEWITVENVEVPYTIEGLEPLTKYELQVQGIYEDAKGTTDWTKSVFFTTTEDVVEPVYYLVGTFNGWSQVDGMIEFVDNKAEGVALEADAEFKVITPAEEEGEWIWYGGEDANGVGFFYIGEDLLGVNITMCDGANFRIYEAGTYDFELVYARDGEVPMLKVTKNLTGISTIAVDSQSNDWYNLNGQKLNGKPVTPGIYINGNKKVIIK